MPLNDDAVLIPGTGAVLTGPVGTAPPTLAVLETFASAGTLPTGFVHLGHTSLEDLPAPGRDGGDVETLGSWQSPSLRSRTDPVTDYWDVTSIQIIDNTVLSFYYGGGDFSDPDEFIYPDAPTPQERAVLFVMNDGGRVVGNYHGKMSIIGVDEIALDAEDFAAIPLRFTRLSHANKSRWIGEGLGTPA